MSNPLLNTGGEGKPGIQLTGSSNFPAPPAVKTRKSPSSWSCYYADYYGKMIHMVDRPIEVTFSKAERLFNISRRTLLRASQRPENDPAKLRTFPQRPSVTRTDWLFKFMFGLNHSNGNVVKSARSTR
jgi:hypothetical protein